MKKQIALRPDRPFHNNMDVAVLDFPNGYPGTPRQRCKITVEFAESDVRQLQRQGMDFAAAMDHYADWLEQVVRARLAQDWEAVEGYAAVMDVIREKVSAYYSD